LPVQAAGGDVDPVARCARATAATNRIRKKKIGRRAGSAPPRARV
jgi:hypothetical protein